MKQFSLNPCTLSVLRALSVMCVAVPMFANAQQATDLGTVGATGSAAASATPVASKVAPVQSSLEARSAQSSVSDEFIRNFTSPVADYSQAIQMTPGIFSYSPNGVGLGDTASTMRGLGDGNNVISFDGVPFNDTNGVSHHSWVFFPSQFIGGVDIDRSPGSAATIGQATYGGTINLLSRKLDGQERTSVTTSDGTWNTTMYGVEHETGQFGVDGASNLLFNVNQMTSDGYQTYNDQSRESFSLKYQYIVSPDTVITAFTSYLDLKNNTPSTKGPTRAQVTQFGPNYLMSGNPTQANYYGYNFYNVATSFQYLDVTSNLGGGWKLDDKIYNYGYHNLENYNGTKMPTSTAATLANETGVDKLNSYHTSGGIFRLSNESAMGTLRTGIWIDYANTYRYQFAANPLTWIPNPTPNFDETYQTTTLQPFVEYEFNIGDKLKITPGVKYASYKQSFDHLQDNGGAVGTLGGVLNKTTGAIVGGASSVSNSVTYTDVLPSLDAHYMIQPNWSAYAQYAAGDLIPPTSVYDVAGAVVNAPPKAQKSTTYQFGSVWKSDRFNVDADIYHIKLDSAYSSTTDAFGNAIYFLNGSEISQGLETEGTYVVGSGFSLYGNYTYGTTKYDTGMWVAGAPKDTETLGVSWADHGWDTGAFVKRVGLTYGDNGATHQAFTISPVIVTNLFANYVIKNPMKYTKQAKIQFAINNLFNQSSITAIKAGSSTSSSAAPSQSDVLTLLPARSMSVTLTLDF